MTSNFEIERDKLMEKVSQGLEQLVSSLGDLNRNLETVNTIGKEFEAPAKVWNQFHKSVMAPDTITPTAAITTLPHANNNNKNNNNTGKTTTTKQQRQDQDDDHDYDMLSSQALAQDDVHTTTNQHQQPN